MDRHSKQQKSSFQSSSTSSTLGFNVYIRGLNSPRALNSQLEIKWIKKERNSQISLERKHAYATDKSKIAKCKLTRLLESHLQDTGLRMLCRLGIRLF
jgi:hypothetical protein